MTIKLDNSLAAPLSQPSSNYLRIDVDGYVQLPPVVIRALIEILMSLEKCPDPQLLEELRKELK